MQMSKKLRRYSAPKLILFAFDANSEDLSIPAGRNEKMDANFD
jgi:hypothetical protein